MDRTNSTPRAREGADAVAFWQRIAAASDDPVLVLDSAQRCVFASASITVETGFRVEHVVGRQIRSIVLDADGSSIVERLDRADQDEAEFGVTLHTVSGRPSYTRATLRRDELDGRLHHVLVLRATSQGRSAESALRRRVELEQLLERVQHRFIHAVPAEIAAVIDGALEEVGRHLGADRAYLLTFDHAARTETMINEWAAEGIDVELGVYTDVSWDLAPAASRRNNELWVSAVPDVSKLDGEWELDRQFFEESGLRSILELPIIIDGHPVGGLGFDWLVNLADWNEDDLTLLGMFASTFAQMLGRDAAEKELVRRSTHDELTGLPNRSGVLASLGDALGTVAAGAVVGVMVFDVDRFQVVNDSLGNDAGDELLRLVGARLSSMVRPGDVVARLGGDEFAVVMPDAPDEWTVSRAAERLRDGLGNPFRFRDRTHLMTASCGIATTGPSDLGAGELLRRAGAAMYRSKELGRSRQTTFDVELEQRLSERLDLDQHLRSALARGEFEVHYQPEIDLGTGATVGAEALLRWRPDGVLRDAGSFIDVLEETGVIVPVGRWVLEQACREAARWAVGGREFVMRVNLSARQLEHPGLTDEVREVLDRYGLHPRHLCLEITETALMANAGAALGLLESLDALGVSLAIDDFGTGYSSLSYLKRFPVDILKIDRSFVDGLPDDGEDHAIVTTIITLAQSLGMTVTAEGIESEGQARALVALGCTRGQGWWYSKAVPVTEMDQRLAADRVAPLTAPA